MNRNAETREAPQGDHFVFAAAQAGTEHQVYDYPGGYAGRFDGLDPGNGTADIEPVTDPAGNLWLCRTDEDGSYSECIPWP